MTTIQDVLYRLSQIEKQSAYVTCRLTEMGFSGYSGFSGQNGSGGGSGDGTSGYSGYSGIGTSGYSGVGTSGYSGSTGISGFSGYSGVGPSYTVNNGLIENPDNNFQLGGDVEEDTF